MTSYVHDNEFPSFLVKEGTVPASPTAGDQRLYVDSADHKLKRVNSSGTITTVEGAGGSGLYSAYLCYQDQKTNGTNGGTFTSGSWITRVLNTEVADTAGHGSVASNQITLDAGTYRVLAFSPGYAVNRHSCRLQNITGSSTLIQGRGAVSFASSNTTCDAVLQGRFTIAVQSVLELQAQCQTTEATDGLGNAMSFSSTEVYASIEFFKE